MTRNMLRVTLEGGGYDVFDAPDGKTAVEIAAVRRPSLVILDRDLPDADGLQVLAAVRSTTGTRELPAIVFTGDLSRLEELRAGADGATHVLGKPVEPSQLLEVVHARLAPSGGRTRGHKVLVVDNEPLKLGLSALRFEGAGYEVETAPGGEEALEIARERRPDAILTAVMMPSMDGFTFCRNVRRSRFLGSIPVVLVSAAYVDEADRALARQMGASALVVRTPDLREALDAIEAGLTGSLIAPSPTTSDDVTALHQERLLVQLERHAVRNEALLRQGAVQATALSIMGGLSEVLAEPRDVPEKLGKVLVHSLDAAGLSTGLLYVTEAGGERRLQAHFGIPADRKAEAEAVFGHSRLLHRIVESGKAVALSSAAGGEDGADTDARDFLARVGRASVLVVPFGVVGETSGELVLASESHDLSETSWIGFARSLALQFGQTVALGQAIKRLAASESRYRDLMERAHDAIFILDPEGVIFEANEHAQTLLGVSRDRIVGHHISAFSPLPAGEAPEYVARFKQTLATGGGLVESVVLRRGDGSRVEVDFSLSQNEIDGQAVVLSIGRDVTQRRRADDALRAAGQQYRILFDSNPHPMWVYDEESLGFLAVNDAALRHYGYTRDEFLALTTLDIRPPEDVPAFRDAQAARRAANPGAPFYSTHTFKHRKKDGSIIEVDIAANSIVFGGRPARLLLATDVTEKQSLETQLVRAQKMEAVGQLAGGVAHDFNNLLGVIKGNTELLIRGLPERSRERTRSEEILRAADRAAALTRQLLAFSRRQVLRPAVIDLNEVVAEVVNMLRRLISVNIQIVTVPGAAPGTVRADAGQMEQMLMNLAINARDAMLSGGRLVIETSNVELDESYARANPEARPGAYVMLAVTDTGHGMDARTMSRIFEPFFTTKDEGKGTGLGLATVYGIVRQSGGTVSVFSEPGHGSTFKVYLPRVEADSAKTVRVAIAAPAGGTETILLVEDAEPLRLLVRELLESAGYRVLDAEAPDKALALVQSTPGPIDLVLTDMVMPRMSGQELATRIAVLRPQARVVFMSGYSEMVAGDEVTLQPGTPFLEKPFTMDAMLRTVRAALDAGLSGRDSTLS